jgi:hypothetical protein
MIFGHTEENIPLHFIDPALDPSLLKVGKLHYILKYAGMT